MHTKDLNALYGLKSVRQVFANRDDAVDVAKILMRHPHILGVELFGSLAREPWIGHDMDLILITDEGRAADFTELVKSALMERDGWNAWEQNRPDTFEGRGALALGRACSYNKPALRAEMAQEALGGNFGELFAKAKQLTAAPMDIFIFPTDWRDHLRSLQEDLPHKDPNFMRNIARDAVRIA